MENRIFIILLLMVLASCNPIPQQSITEPLTPEQLSKIFEKDTSFKETYEFIEVANKLLLNTDVKKAEFIDLNYRDFHDFYLEANNSSDAYNKLDSTFNAEWDQKVKAYEPKIDSISNYWKEFYADKKIREYVIVEYGGVVKYTRYGFTDSFGLEFLIVPTKDYVLDKVRVSYEIKSRVSAEDLVHERILGIDQVYSGNEFEINRPISELEEVEIKVSSSNSDVFYELYPDGLEYDKVIVPTVEEVVVNGKTIKNQANLIPYEVKNLWIRSLKDSTLATDQFTVTPFIKEFLDKDFDYQFVYSQKKIEEYLRAKDPLSSKYFFQVADIVSKFKD